MSGSSIGNSIGGFGGRRPSIDVAQDLKPCIADHRVEDKRAEVAGVGGRLQQRHRSHGPVKAESAREEK